MIRPVPDVSEQENARTVPAKFLPGAVTTRRDPVEPVPVGSYIACVFRVTGYDPDCDGSLMARLAQVDRTGEPTGWETDSVGLYPDTDVAVDSPDDLHKLAHND